MSPDLGGPLCPECGTSCIRESPTAPWCCTNCGSVVSFSDWSAIGHEQKIAEAISRPVEITEASPTEQPQNLAQMSRRYTALKREHGHLMAQDKLVCREMDKLEGEISEAFIDLGIKRITVDDATVHTYEEVLAALQVPEGMDEVEARWAAVQCLISMGRERVVNFNHTSMRALVKELMDDDGSIPEPLGKYIRVQRRWRVGVRNQ